MLLLFSFQVVSDLLQPLGLQHADSLTFTICQSLPKLISIETVTPSNHFISVTLFSFCLQSFPASGYFPGYFHMNQLFASGGQSIGASDSASVLPMSIQGWFPLEWTGWISLQSKGLSRVFCNTAVQKHQFFATLASLWSNSHIHIWLLENHSLDFMDLCQQSDAFAF